MGETAAVTYTSSVKPARGRTLVCKRCKRSYPYPEPGERPIRCECGWWYYNDGVAIRESYQQRIEPYREPADVRALFHVEV